jgi:arginase family enzyme
VDYTFLTPVSNEVLAFAESLSSQHFGSKISLHTAYDFPVLDNVKITLIGVIESRGGSQETEGNLDAVRKEIYSLFPGNWNLGIADLGDLDAGETIEDTYFALQQLVKSLLKNNCIPLIIGGTQDLTYPMYRAYDGLEQMVNLVSIDSKFDFGKEKDSLSATSYLTKIIIDEPNNLFNYSNIGYQTYANSQEEIDLVEKLFFDAYRLGDISNSIALAEPVLRDADCVSIDMHAVKSSDSGNFSVFSPNGFTGKEICALARYAGISDKVSAFGVFNSSASQQEAVLIAQLLWYFIEGVEHRSHEYPFGSKEQYIKYTVPLDGEELVFYKSNKTDRWWIEIPYINTSHTKIQKSTLLPCSYEEYLAACANEIPERWWKAQRKNLV